MKFIRNFPISTYNCFNTKGIKHITRLRLSLSHLRDQKFKHDFLDSLNPSWRCGLEIDTTCHFLLHCPNFKNERSHLLKNVSRITNNKLPSCDQLLDYSYQTSPLWWRFVGFGNKHSDINTSVEFILSSKGFDGPLL